MARTESKMLPLGTEAPSFELPDTEGKRVSLSHSAGARGFLVMFICNHCPYVKHIAPKLSQVTAAFIEKGIAVFGINSNDVENYPDDSPELMASEKKARGYIFPYLYDESQNVARAYDAACTPDFFLFDSNKKLVYRGRFDGSRPANTEAVTGKDLTDAVEALLNGRPIATAQKPSLGCNIKWKSN
jgi:peroxiredoxin